MFLKFRAVVNTICLLALVTLGCFAAQKLDAINRGVWFQNYLLTKDETILEYMGSSGLRAPTDEWPYWNMAVQSNPVQGNLIKIGSLVKPSKCQIQPKDICTEIAYIWRKFETLDANRAQFESFFYGHVFEENRGGLDRTQIKPRHQ